MGAKSKSTVPKPKTNRKNAKGSKPATKSKPPFHYKLDSQGVGWITLQSAPLNILNIELLRSLNRCLRNRIGIADQKVLVIQSGLRTIFSAGASIEEHRPEHIENLLQTFHETVRLIRSVDQPTIALVQRGCLGGGWELALSCDVIVASNRATFAFPEITLGVFPPAGSVLLPTRCGPQVALDLILTGRTIPAKQALEAGLVARVIADKTFARQSKAFIREFSRNSASSMRFAKRALRDGLERTDEDGISHAESIYIESLLPTADATEGIEAYLEKRKPRWDY